MRYLQKNYEYDQKKLQDAIDSHRKSTYLSIISNGYDFRLENSYIKVGWLKFGQDKKIFSITNNTVNFETLKEADFKPFIEAQNRKTLCRIVSAIICDSFWSMALKYWLVWRWLYYVRRLDNYELESVISASFFYRNHAQKYLNSETNLENLKRLKWLFETKSWLFGLVRCKDYEYLWCFTKAQFDLMASLKY